MTTKIEDQLDKLIRGQQGQAERDSAVLKEVESIRETVERLHDRLDGVNEKTIIHEEQIKTLDGKFCKSQVECEKTHQLIWDKMREKKQEAITTAKKDMKLWLFGTLLIAIGSIALSFIKNLLL